MNLSLFNTLTRKKEIFKPLDENLIKMYVCGPTVYDHPHIGNARSNVVYDILYRILILIYGEDRVKYVRNITDVDDKIINRAKEEKILISQLTRQTTEYFHNDMKYLNCLSPNVEPKATEHIPDMINIIQHLLLNNYAYKSEGNIYFNIRKYDKYLELSGRSMDEMYNAVRIENNLDKANPGDFILWKTSSNKEEDFANFDSPFGRGRPGWHIECSAMSYKYLGEDFDIHGGGADLIFPHHTNEIAQSRCAFPRSQFAHTWVHNGFLTVNNEKMSKSLGNFLTVKDLIEKDFKGEVIRLFLLSAHYRRPLDYNIKALKDSEKLLSYWYKAIEDLNLEEIIDEEVSLPQTFIDVLLDDMNTPLAVKIMNDFAKQIHRYDKKEDKIKLAKILVHCTKFFGLNLLNYNNYHNINVSMINDLIGLRLQAKRANDWSEADKIRNNLLEMGIFLEDRKDGTTSWSKINND